MSGRPPDPSPHELTTLLPGDPALAAQIAAGLQDRYAADGRFYHTLTHIYDVLNHIKPFLDRARQPRALLLAAWFHDAVYDPRRSDNEMQSAAYTTAVLADLGTADAVIKETARLIGLTVTHKTAVGDTDGHILLDADLAILAAAPADYAVYAAAIRREYAHVPTEAYRQGRTAVLAQLLARPQLYYLSAHTAWETPARLNLRQEMAQLSKGV
ncbi:MAG: hypothetical protein H6659_08985 [Ardenticatenaceae bacterium]|nr:hypothetical protein [Ardenticatenaceae bacterium]